MAITLFTRQRKQQQILAIAFVAILLLVLGILLFGSGSAEELPERAAPREEFAPLVPPSLRLDEASFRESPLRNLNPPPQPTELPENRGRSNPFL